MLEMNFACREDETEGRDQASCDIFQASCDIFRTGALMVLLHYYYDYRPCFHHL